jgi:hypothetical protein
MGELISEFAICSVVFSEGAGGKNPMRFWCRSRISRQYSDFGLFKDAAQALIELRSRSVMPMGTSYRIRLAIVIAFYFSPGAIGFAYGFAVLLLSP